MKIEKNTEQPSPTQSKSQAETANETYKKRTKRRRILLPNLSIKKRINIEKFAGFFFLYLFDRISECINNLMVWPLRVETNVENGLDIKTKRFRLNFLMGAKNAESSVLTFKGSTKTIILRNRSVFYLRIRSHLSPPPERKKNKNRPNEREKSGATHSKFLSEFCSSIDDATLYRFFLSRLLSRKH